MSPHAKPPWWDVFPASFPWSSGTPLVGEQGQRRIATGPKRIAGMFGTSDVKNWRVDLDHFLGFADALHTFACSGDFGGETLPYSADDGVTGMAHRWLHGETTDADRMALAKALAASLEGR